MRKGRLNPRVFHRRVPSEFSFCGGKTRFTHAIAANKRANSHNFKIKNLNLLTITFLAVYLMNRGKSSYMNESSMRVKNTFRQIIAKLVPLFFKCSCALHIIVLIVRGCFDRTHDLNKLFLHLMRALCLCLIMISHLVFFHVYY